MKLKHHFKVLLSNFYVRIKSGPLKGKKWIWTSGGKFIKGEQEPYKTEAILANFKKGEIFFDIGAHFGYFSAIAAHLNEGEGKVFAFEPRPMNAGFFRKHMKVNGFSNVVLYQAAVGDAEGDVMFDSAHGSATGRVTKDGDLKVKQVSIDRLISEGTLPMPTFIKIDVEGGEIEVLKGLEKVIASSRPKMVVATHNPECHSFVLGFLEKHNYRYQILNPDSIKGDTEIVALP
jgi:FkbM family methyltransferase